MFYQHEEFLVILDIVRLNHRKKFKEKSCLWWKIPRMLKIVLLANCGRENWLWVCMKRLNVNADRKKIFTEGDECQIEIFYAFIDNFDIEMLLKSTKFYGTERVWIFRDFLDSCDSSCELWWHGSFYSRENNFQIKIFLKNLCNNQVQLLKNKIK